MDLQSRKIEFVQEFLKLQSEEVITQLEKLLKKETKKIHRDLKPMTVDEYKERINNSKEDSKNGRLTKVDDLLSEIEGWS
jgi:hypothetical protein